MDKNFDWLHFEGAAFRVWQDALALGLVEGDILLCRPSVRYEADNRYLTNEGEPVMVGLSEQRGCLFLRHADGVAETLAKPEVDSQIAAFVTRVILNPAYRRPRTAPKPAAPMAIPLRL